ncbi:unnamed protein product [Rhizophagus irregularis]|uniref:F-box domain-containing protein n=2 Tax=Rhizophagus irregularis TaxID=588596 RepID=A0A915ZPD8_9GLOM|nr:unnamed protein product [Rhizophagus irregularis]CAB5185247.1 unnamed protein product [Rhizophagus irregularis]CAB5382873.1 unnamed protein product [Rhizophagus irregularis]
MEILNIDCLILIFNELSSDNNSLYSCLLVNKEWCHLVIPILWGNYPNYTICINSTEKFFNIILSCLSTSSKQLLIDNNIRLSQTILSKSSFNYVSLCKFLKIEIINNIINMIFRKEILTNVDYSKERDLLEQEIYKLFVSQCEGIKELEWQSSQPIVSFPGASTGFSQLYNLNIDLFYVNSNSLYEMSQICKDLNELTIKGCSQDIPGLISLIDAQRNLKSVSFDFQTKEGTCEELSKALARKGCTINNLSLYGSVDIIPLSFLMSLNNLKDLIIYYDFESYGRILKFQKYLANSKFPDLQILDISDDLLCFKELSMLIENTNGNIMDIFVYTSNKSAENTGMFINSISNNCPKIEFLTTYLGPKDLIHIKSLLKNCRNLKSLRFNSLNEIKNIGDGLLNILAKFSPKSLSSISISGKWKYSVGSFENLFESYKKRRLLHFDIHDEIVYITTEHAKVVKKYFDEGVIAYSNLIITGTSEY